MDSLGSFERERGMYHFVSPILRFLQVEFFSPSNYCVIPIPIMYTFLLQLFTLVASFSAITSASQNGLSYASYDAFKYLIAATVIATIWTLVMLIVDSVMLAVGKSARFAVLKHILLKLDFVSIMRCYCLLLLFETLIFLSGGCIPHIISCCS